MIEINNKKKMIRHGIKLGEKEREKEMVASNTPPIIIDHSPHHCVELITPLQLTRHNIIFCGGRRPNMPPNLTVIF